MFFKSKWVNTFRLRGRAGSGRGFLGLLFWIWGAVGLFFNGGNLLALKGDVGVGTSTYMAAATLVWIGGMIFFGVGALILPGDYIAQRQQRADDAPDLLLPDGK
ncbi:MAG: hypothetical protein P4L99_05480 [Chthoniobacter sp.]|nr:hypothetical protein [Chthoniobacter sp.]